MVPVLRRIAPLALVAVAVFTPGCGSRSTSPTSPSGATPAVPIMAASRLSAVQIVTWFNGRQPRPSGSYAGTVPIESLAAMFVEEGAAEGVSGDVAFMQSVVETGWFRFAGSVPAASNNFAGIGATDTNPSPAVFPDVRTGVRAQVQHLRAYADATAVSCTVPPLHNPCVDPRFNLVLPKGKAPTWNEMGNGNWATASTYAQSILALYAEALRFHGVG